MMSRGGGYTESIPFDLEIEILITRLPTKSLARFRCVSKLWESFISKYLSHRKLLFSCQKYEGDTSFFTSPQPQDSSSPLVADYQMSYPSNFPIHIFRPVHGLVCGINQQSTSVSLICNPTTGQFLALPKLESWKILTKVSLGYDPIDKQFKVLYMTYPYDKFGCKVLTLGTGEKLSWRIIECDIGHEPPDFDCSGRDYVRDEICIQGVTYYFARLRSKDEIPVVICFNVRYEKFSYIRIAEGMKTEFRTKLYTTALVNHKGKLAKLQVNIVGGICNGIQLWVLKDAGKHEWSNNIYALPSPNWKSIVGETELRSVGMTGSGEIVFSPESISDTFYLLYYNPERNTTLKVEIRGMEDFKNLKVHTFLDNVEEVKDLKLMVGVD